MAKRKKVSIPGFEVDDRVQAIKAKDPDGTGTIIDWEQETMRLHTVEWDDPDQPDSMHWHDELEMAE